MTRKHFVAIAAAIANTRRNYSDSSYQAALDDVAEELAHTLARFNPAFSRAFFLDACKGEPQ